MTHHIAKTKTGVHFGPDLAYQLRGKSAAQRAVLAVEDGDGPIYILNPTNAQRAGLFKVSPGTLARARSLPPDQRKLVKQGLRHLVEKQDRVAAAICVIRNNNDGVVRLLEALGAEHVYRALDRITAPMMQVAAE
jgi:hypothetical protein